MLSALIGVSTGPCDPSIGVRISSNRKTQVTWEKQKEMFRAIKIAHTQHPRIYRNKHTSLICAYTWQTVTLSSIVFLKHKVLSSVATDKIRWIDRVDKLGHKRSHILHTEVWTSSLLLNT